MKTLNKHEMPWRCDGCAFKTPTMSYSLPPGTPIMTTQDTRTGEVRQMQSAGLMSLCDECHAILVKEGSGRRGATLIARRMIDNHVQLMRFTGDDRTRIVAAAVKTFERLLPLLTDPRPAVPQERAVIHLPDGMEPPEVWCPDCGRPMKPGDTCHGRTF